MNISAALMLKAPRPGTVKTRLAADLGVEQATAIYRSLVEHQIRQIPCTWQTVVHYAPADAEQEMSTWIGELLPNRAQFVPQCEGDLGKRMRLAVRTALSSGGQAVALIGGDCPGLTTAVLHTAEAAMATSDVVIVPATDGGYVLLMLKAKAEHPALFENISWSSSAVLEQTLAAASALGLTVTLLPELQDVDDLPSLKACSAIMSEGSLRSVGIRSSRTV